MYDFDLELEDFILEEEIMLEAVKQGSDKAQSELKTIMQHMLKHQYQPERQGKSWCDSIGDSYNEYNEVINNKKYGSKKNIINNIDLDECYKDARNHALSETKLNQSVIPKQRPSEWDIDYITNYDKIIEFLKDKYNPYATYNFKSEEDMVKFMKGKLK